MRKVVFTSEARANLRDIAFFIARGNRDRALTFVGELQDKARALAYSPTAFPIVQRYADQGIRCRSVRDYLIFYTVGNEAIRIVAIVHGARDLTDLFG